MSDIGHPGYDEAVKLGYSISAHSADKTVTWYTKIIYSTVLNLAVFRVSQSDELQCEISGNYKMITLTSGKISFPHPRIHLFEDQILQCLPIGS